MGLDNGLIIRGKTERAKQFLKEHFEDLQLNYSSNEYEFHYSRKCWNIRQKFLDEFENKGYDGETGFIHLKKKDLYRVIDILKFFLDENNWEYKGLFSIWEWHEMLPSIAKSISNLKTFLYELEIENSDADKKLKGKNFEIYYYDSY